jgi:regulator of protease activity HflC (stomatin/prohibitin superfamily)
MSRNKRIVLGVIGLIIFLTLWSGFVIVPAGYRGTVLWFGNVEDRIMPSGLNFKVPFAETVINMSVQVQPHPFKEIDASSKEYQIVKMTGMMNFHLDPQYVNIIYRDVGLDFATKVIDPAFNDFVKEVVPTYPITEILPKREEIRQKARTKLAANLERYHVIIDDIYFSDIRFSSDYEQAVERKQVAQQDVQTQAQITEQNKMKAEQQVALAKGNADSILINAQGQAKANDVLARSITPAIIQFKAIEKWNGQVPAVTGGAAPLINLEGITGK